MAFGKPEPFPWQQGRRVVRTARETLTSGSLAQFGIPSLDEEIRGLRLGDFVVVAGPAHGFKSQLMVSTVLQNPDVNFVWCSPDEGHEFVLQKLICAERGLTQEEYEDLLRDDPKVFDQSILDIERHVAITDASTPDDIRQVASQAKTVFGEVHCIIFDYVELLELGLDIKPKMAWLKKFGQTNRFAVVAIHQSNKIGLDLSQVPTLQFLAETGHQQSFVVVWMKRPYIDPNDPYVQMQDSMLPSVECWLLKNKRGKTLHRPIKLAVMDGNRLEEWNLKHDRKLRPDVSDFRLQRPLRRKE